MEHSWKEISWDFDSYEMICINCKLSKISASEGLYYFCKNTKTYIKTYIGCDEMIIKNILL